jgi:hypothetical protein
MAIKRRKVDGELVEYNPKLGGAVLRTEERPEEPASTPSDTKLEKEPVSAEHQAPVEPEVVDSVSHGT